MIIDTKKLQKEVLDNKRRHNFNTTDIKFELLLLYGEVNELFKGWLKQDDDNINEELAIEINKNRIYKNGVKVSKE